MTTALLVAGLKVAVLCALPFLLGIGLVGVGVGVLQGATGVQDQSSSQAMRLAAAGVLAVVLGPWVLRTLQAFTLGLWRDLGRFLQ